MRETTSIPTKYVSILVKCNAIYDAHKCLQVKEGATPTTLANLFDDYYCEATRLQKKYSGQIQLLVGMEIDWIRPSSQEFIESLLRKYQLDVFIGSVHHVHGIPTDYNREFHLVARERSGGTDEGLFEDYFDLQLDMLKKLKPPIVGHFDLIRLWSDDKDGSFAKYDRVWKKVSRNLDFIVEYGGVLEVNSAALRKGMREPYPKAEICKVCFASKPASQQFPALLHGPSQYGSLLCC